MSAIEIFSKELNQHQLSAIEHLEGPMLILAGAGSGKTRVLTYRIASLVIQGLATPTEILAVTFTNKAAREMEARTQALLEKFGVPIWDRLWISTFHSTCVRILREHIHHLGYERMFGIYDSTDQLNMLKRIIEKLNLDEKSHPAKKYQALIENAKMQAITPERMAARAAHGYDRITAEVYENYEAQMKSANSLDFGDLLVKTHQLFQEKPEILAYYQNKFRFIMVDEYQDTNRIQYLLVRALASQHRNLCVVGDEDQSIYSWRGADIRNILDFEKDFADAKVVKLLQNYRSTQTIVKAASEVIKYNTQRKDKELYTENAEGEKIHLREEANEYEEARFVVRTIQSLAKHAEHDLKSLKDFAIFYRTNAQSRVLEEQLRSHAIPYKIVGGVRFYDRMEIKDLIGYLKLVANPKDDMAFQRVINTPARGIGKTTVEKLDEVALNKQISLLEAIPFVISAKVVNSGTAQKLNKFLEMMNGFIESSKISSLEDLFHQVLDGTGYVKSLRDQDTLEAEARIDNLEELDNAIAQFAKERGAEGTLQAFLEEIALVSDIDSMNEMDNSVTLMTLHVSKGLEYPVVFIVGMEEGIFPTGRATDSEDEFSLEEERRLAYVGMTRAERILYLTHARTRKVWGVDQQNAPSRFINEIPPQYLDKGSSVQRPAFIQRFQEKYGSPNEAEWQSPQSSPQPRWRSFDESEKFPTYEEESQDSSGGELRTGMRVRHPTFGVGTIHKLEGTGDQATVSIIFQSHQLKKFVVKFARLEPV